MDIAFNPSAGRQMCAQTQAFAKYKQSYSVETVETPYINVIYKHSLTHSILNINNL